MSGKNGRDWCLMSPHHERLRSYYARYNAKQLHEIDSVLEYFKGRETQVLDTCKEEWPRAHCRRKVWSCGNRVHAQLQNVCGFLSTLVVLRTTSWQEFLGKKIFVDSAKFFQKIFELGRRHKIIKPKTNVRWVWQAQVSVVGRSESGVVEAVRFLLFANKLHCLRRVKAGSRIETATRVIAAEMKSRSHIQCQVKQKDIFESFFVSSRILSLKQWMSRNNTLKIMKGQTLILMLK